MYRLPRPGVAGNERRCCKACRAEGTLHRLVVAADARGNPLAWNRREAGSAPCRPQQCRDRGAGRVSRVAALIRLCLCAFVVAWFPPSMAPTCRHRPFRVDPRQPAGKAAVVRPVSSLRGSFLARPPTRSPGQKRPCGKHATSGHSAASRYANRQRSPLPPRGGLTGRVPGGRGLRRSGVLSRRFAAQCGPATRPGPQKYR